MCVTNGAPQKSKLGACNETHTEHGTPCLIRTTSTLLLVQQTPHQVLIGMGMVPTRQPQVQLQLHGVRRG